MAQNLSDPLISNSGPTPSGTTSFYSKNKKFFLLLGFIFLAGISVLLVRWLSSRVLGVNEVASFHHEHPANIFSISEDNSILVTATESGNIHAWNIQDKSSLSKFVYPAKVTGIGITYNNQFIVASGDDRFVRVFSLKTNSQVAEFEHPGQVTQFQIPEGELYVVTICGDDKLRIWDIEKNKSHSSIESSGGIITAFDYSGKYNKVAFGTKSGLLEVYTYLHSYIRSFSVDLEKPIAQVNLNNDLDLVSVQFVNNSFATLTTKKAFSRVKARLDFNFNNSIVKLGKESIYAVVAGEKIEVLDIYLSEKKIDEFTHGNRVTSVAITPYGYHVISASDDNMLRVWEIGSRNEATSIRSPGKVQNIILSRDLSYFAAGGDDGYVRVYTLYT
jgi:WD40 repeat protein